MWICLWPEIELFLFDEELAANLTQGAQSCSTTLSSELWTSNPPL
jgi:hypothetical protein